MTKLEYIFLCILIRTFSKTYTCISNYEVSIVIFTQYLKSNCDISIILILQCCDILKHLAMFCCNVTIVLNRIEYISNKKQIYDLMLVV